MKSRNRGLIVVASLIIAGFISGGETPNPINAQQLATARYCYSDQQPNAQPANQPSSNRTAVVKVSGSESQAEPVVTEEVIELAADPAY